MDELRNRIDRVLAETANSKALLRRWATSKDYLADKFLLHPHLGQLAAEFPYRGGRLYRGLNFLTPQDYMTFRRSIRDGTIKSGVLSSWTPRLSSAEHFATTFTLSSNARPDPAQMAAYRIRTDTKERIVGFVGVVLCVDVKAGIGIDVSASDQGLEDEVILPPGEYQIVGVRLMKAWRHLLKNADVNAEFIRFMKSGKIPNERMQYILHNRSDELSDDVKGKLVDTTLQRLATMRITAEVKPHSSLARPSISKMFPAGEAELTFSGKFIRMLSRIDDLDAFDWAADSPYFGAAKQRVEQQVNRLFARTALSGARLRSYEMEVLKWTMKFVGLDVPDVPKLRSFLRNEYNRLSRNEAGVSDHNQLGKEIAEIINMIA